VRRARLIFPLVAACYDAIACCEKTSHRKFSVPYLITDVIDARHNFSLHHHTSFTRRYVAHLQRITLIRAFRF
jgi:hypothetical protein